MLANDPQSTRILRGRQHELDLAGLKLMEFAPDLLERDLCIVELSLAQLVLSEDLS